MGIANANVADMVVHDINAERRPAGPSAPAHRRGQRHRRRRPQRPRPPRWSTSTTSTSSSVASTAPRGRPSRAPSSSAGEKLYIYPEQYEGQECDPLIFCTGPVPAQQVEPLFPWLMEQTGAKTFYLPSADYIWPHVLNEKVREVVTGHGGTHRRRGVLPPRPHGLRRDGGPHHGQRCGRRVQHDRPAGAHAVPRAAARGGVHQAGRAHRVHLLRRELPQPRARRAGRGALRLPRLLPRGRDPFSTALVERVRRAAIRAAPSSRPAVRARACTAASSCGRPPSPRRARSTGRRRQGARHGEPRRRTRRSRRDGPRSAPPPAEHVHRPGAQRRRSRSSRTSATSTPRRPSSAERQDAAVSRPGREAAWAVRIAADLTAGSVGRRPRETTVDRLHTLDYALGELRQVVGTLDDSVMDGPTNCEPWTVRRLASHALNNQLVWAGLVTGQQLVPRRGRHGRRAHRRRPRAGRRRRHRSRHGPVAHATGSSTRCTRHRSVTCPGPS